jgi:hypothetical protein
MADPNFTPTGTYESLQEVEDEKGGKCKRWKSEIKAAQKEFEDWWKQADDCERRFLDDRQESYEFTGERRFNIYTSNVQIMQSALFNAVPKVEVSRTFKDSNDEVGRVAANILQRVIQQDLDAPRTDFSPAMENAIENRLVPGMGSVWIRLETTTELIDIQQETLPAGLNNAPQGEQQSSQGAAPSTPDDQSTVPSSDIPQEVKAGDEKDSPPAPPQYQKVVDQQVRTEHVHYKDFLYSPCRTWEERRWVARKVQMTRDKLVKRFGEEIGKEVPMDDDEEKTANPESIRPEHKVFKTASVYEIWDREKREVIWLCPNCDYLLDTRKDPLGITDFDPCPKPLLATTTTSRLVPVPDFVLWQDQYNSLDLVNTRIDLLTEACKVVGVYDKASEGVQRLLGGNENTLIPVDNWAMFAEKGGIKGQVDWLPLDVVTMALDKLRQAREDIKQQIYELTGIADIIRGASKASETLGAQKLKAQFASVRIQSLQKDIMDFGTDILRIRGEIVVRHYTPEMLMKKANAANMDEADLPWIPKAIALLKDWQNAQWRVTIQPDSLSQTDYDQEKAERIEFLGAVSTYMEKAIVAVQGMPALLPLTVSLLKFGIAGFRVGKDIEGAIDNALKIIEQTVQQQAANPKPDPAAQKAQAETQAIQAKTQADIQSTQAKTQAHVQATTMKTQADAKNAQIKNSTALLTARVKAHAAAMGAASKNAGTGPGGRVPPTRQ